MDQQMDKATSFVLTENGVQPFPSVTLNHIHIPYTTSHASKFLHKAHSMLPYHILFKQCFDITLN